MKFYGRAPTFLAMTGYEQVRPVVAAIAGDRGRRSGSSWSCPRPGSAAGQGVVDDPDPAAEGGCCGATAKVGISIGHGPARR
jgi:hypothetical protein